MKKTMTKYEIAHELMQDDNAKWSRAGAFALADYYEQLEEDLGETIEFDAVAIRCEFSEYASLEDWAKEYSPSDWVNFFTYEDSDKAISEYIQERGQLIEFDGGVIVSQF
jgi:hypothetical protein